MQVLFQRTQSLLVSVISLGLSAFRLYLQEKRSALKPLTPGQIWEAALGSLELQVSRPSYATWLKDTVGLAAEDNQMVVGVPSPFVAQWLERRMSSLIETTISQITGQATGVEFRVVQRNSNPAPKPAALSSSQEQINPHQGNPAPSAKLNPRYTLDSFVVGESNQLAYAGALAVASKSGSAYNPLFLYGGVGLGKTHLLHGIGHASISKGLRCLYVSSEQFTNEFISSIQMKRTSEFREKYRSVDVLLIDDIQFLRGKEAIQESFFHTFNDLHNSNHQIVIACDRPSAELSPLEDRLRSRFQWGLSADIQMPDRETRRAILEVKAGSIGVGVPDAVLDLISDHFLSSVRDLEGALNRVCAYADLTAQPLCVDLAYRSLGDLLTTKKSFPPTPDLVIDQVASFYNIDRRIIISKRRDRKIALARQVAIYLLRELIQMPLKEIGSLMGNRDHTTVRHAWSKTLLSRDNDSELRTQISIIRDGIEAFLQDN